MNDEQKPFTVRQLIETLAAFPQDWPVMMRMEGYLGEVGKLRVEGKDGGRVVLEDWS